LNIKVKGQGHVGSCVFLACMILFEPVGLHSPKVTMSFARWHHFCLVCACMLYYCNMVGWAWWDWEQSG